MRLSLLTAAAVAAVAAASALALPARAAEPAPDRSARDRAAPVATIGFIDARADRPLDLVFRYWRDVHGVLATRIDGIWQYWQHHLADPDPALWPAMGGVERAVPSHLVLEGFAEVTFRDAATRRAMAGDPAARQIQRDEQNVFRGTFLHNTAEGDSVTLLDRRASNAPQGERPHYRAIVLLRKALEADDERFDSYLSERLAPALAAGADAIKVRYHRFLPYDGQAWDTPGVDNTLAEGEAYQGWLELVYPDRQRAAAALRSQPAAGALAAAPEVISAAHAYPVAQVWTPLIDGRPTHIGLRGYATWQTIERVGAGNQKSEEVLDLLYSERTKLPVGAAEERAE
jgi:hypothetical protein